MSAAKPPPLPGGEHPAASYIRFVLVVLPAATLLLFASVFLFPKVLALWADAGLVGAKVQWLISATQLLTSIFAPITGLTILISIGMEFRVRTWRIWRSWFLVFAAAGLNLITLIAITLIAISACLAAPMVAFKDKTKAPTKLEKR